MNEERILFNIKRSRKIPIKLKMFAINFMAVIIYNTKIVLVYKVTISLM